MGSSIVIPAGWYVTKKSDGYLLQDPDRQMSFYLVEMTALTGYDAINAIMKEYDPDPEIHSTGVSRRSNNKKYEVFTADYYVLDPQDTSRADVSRRIWASSYRKGKVWEVALIDGATAAVDRREAQIGLILESFHHHEEPEEKSSSTAKSVPMDAAFFKTLGDFTQHVMEKLKVPGASVAIVKDGKIVYEKGFGIREEGKNSPVTPQTLFLIASMTKPLTTLLMARLVDAGKIAWDTPVQQLLPAFRLADTKMSGNLTLKYTVCACAGLPRQDMDLIFERGDTTPEAILEKMRVMAPTTGFGETFQYSNIMVAAGGYIAAHSVFPAKPLGIAYDEAMQTYIFDPLGMKDTTFNLQSQHALDAAAPHGDTIYADYTPMPFAYNDCFIPFRPAAGCWSNVEDLSKYLSMEMAKGIGPDGNRFVSEANLMKRREPTAKISEDSAYGLGLFLDEIDGVKVIGHGGNAIGYTSTMDFMPDYGAGIIVLCNADHVNNFIDLVKHRFIQLLIGKESHLQQNVDAAAMREGTAGQQQGDYYDKESRFDTWVRDFEGDYTNELLGRVSIHMTEQGGVLDMGKWRSRIAKVSGNGNAIEFILTTPPLTWLNFTLDDKEGQKTLIYNAPQRKYVFQLMTGGKPKTGR